MKENNKNTPEIWSSVMAQWHDLCNDSEPSYQIINDTYFILIPKQRIRKCILKLLDKKEG